jgi:hypothetical protein
VKEGAALGAAFVTTALVWALPASAADPRAAPVAESEAVSLLYEDSAPADCPSEASFQAEVSKLTSKARFTKEPGARRVRIELSNRGSDVLGRLITGDGKNQSSREVRGRDCKEVSSALAIAVALTIDPAALLGDPEPAEPPPQPAAPPKREPAPPPPAVSRVEPPPPRRPLELRWGAGVGLTLQSAWAPKMRPGGHGFLVLAVGDRLRVALGGSRFITREVDGTSFGAWMGHGSASWSLLLLGRFRPYAGVGFEAGAVDASGSGLGTSVEAQRPWQAVSAGLGLRLETDSFFVQLGGNLLAPLSRQRYLVSDSAGNVRLLYEVPPLGLRQETSLGVFL